MRGVYRVKEKLFLATYSSLETGKLQRYFNNEDEALNQRISWENNFGEFDNKLPKKDRRGEIIGFYKILDYIPNTNHKYVVVKNIVDNKIFEITIGTLLRGRGIPRELAEARRNYRTGKGVSFAVSKNKWMAHMSFDGKKVLNKYFNTKEEAIAARLAAEEKYFKPILDKYEKENPDEWTRNKNYN